MRETNFIKQNTEKWTEFEEILKQEKKDPDKLSDLFIQITDDLSFSRTFYPNRYVRVYLNSLAQKTFLNIYKNKKEKRGRFFLFWKEELPLLIYQSRREFLLSFFIFLLSFSIGVFSSMHDHDFAALILGDSYVNMTTENIKSGDPMKVYKESNGLDMFLGITLNNLRVAFMTYLFGILYAVGTIALILYNGIMVGTFQYFFIEHDVFRESFLTIWMHGTLEISCIIIAGAAGLVLGRGLVFPGTYSRIQSLQISARSSLKIMIGIAPIIVTAAIIESFFTRFTETPDLVRGCLIFFSLFFILAYFVWYPIQKSRKSTLPPEVKLPATKPQSLDITAIRNNGEIFGDIFIFFRKHLRLICIMAFLTSLVSSTLLWIINPYEWRTADLFERWSFLSLGEYFHHHSLVVYGINSLSLAVNATFIFGLFIREIRPQVQATIKPRAAFFRFFLRHFYKVLIASAIINALFFLPAVTIWILIPLVFPFSVLLLFCMLYENNSLVAAAGKIRRMISESFLRVLGLFLLLTLGSFIIYFFIDSPVIWLFVEVFRWNVMLEQETVNLVYEFVLRFITFFSIHLLLPLSFTGFSLQFFSLQEIKDAASLKHRIAMIGMKNGKS